MAPSVGFLPTSLPTKRKTLAHQQTLHLRQMGIENEDKDSKNIAGSPILFSD
jgi:hypothetical protein